MILLYADDPGAANYIAPLPAAFAEAGLRTRVVFDDALEKFATERGFAFEPRSARPPAELLAGVDLAVVGTSENPDCVGNALIDAARAARVPTLGAVDLPVNGHLRFRGRSGDPLRHAPDALAVPDGPTAKRFAELGFDPTAVFVCGHPHYDAVRRRRRDFSDTVPALSRRTVFPGAPDSQPVWLFLAEGIDRLDPSQSMRRSTYTLAGRGDSDFRTCIVAQELVDAARALDLEPWLILRLHPKSDPADLAPVADFFDSVSADGDPLPLVWAADLTVGLTTMLLMEAYLLGRPHLCVVPDLAERAWLPTAEAGLTPACWTRDGLRATLAKPLHAPAADLLPADCSSRVVAAAQSAIYKAGKSLEPRV